MDHSARYDVIVIGTGAGGGTLAFALAKAGKKVLILERGNYLPREKENWSTIAVLLEGKYRPNETWFTLGGESFRAPCHYYVGGNTKLYGAALLRFRREDFGELLHADGISPAWPIPYEELEPYYSQAEDLYEVRGRREVDPTDPPVSSSYSWAPVSHEPRIEQLAEALRGCGLRPFWLPLGIRLNEVEPDDSACIRCDTCSRFPCLVHGKSDAEVICIRPALRSSNTSLLTNAYVERLETDPSGREITSVQVFRGGVRETYKVDIVVLAAGAINSAAILLRSASSIHPFGLANRSGLVGRNLMLHNIAFATAISREPHQTRFPKTLGINDFYFGGSGDQYPLGNIQLMPRSEPETLPEQFLKLANTSAQDLSDRAIDFCVISEDLPRVTNRVALNTRGEIEITYQPNNRWGRDRLLQKLQGLLSNIDCLPKLLRREDDGLAASANWALNHQCGTIRFGLNPETSVLNSLCRAHELDNLYVVDSSIFPSSAAVNPSLTIMANALRVAQHIVHRLS